MRKVFIGLSVMVLASACSDPLRDVARLDDVAARDGAATVTQTPAEANNTGGGLFSRLLNRQPDDPTNAAVEAALSDAEVTVDGEPVATEAPIVVDATATPQRRGLFGLFGGRTAAPAEPELEVTEVIEDPTGAEVVAAAVPAATVSEPAAPSRGLAGLFRRSPGNSPPRNGPDAADVGAGAVLPFGEVARVCGIRRSELGTEVDGGGGFKIYDTIPNSTAPRPFYITGFADDCARTFTGAVVISGDIETHEFVRYQGSNEGIGYTNTDNAYEALKASFCRVGRGQPCGARADRLNRNTHFITVYNFFGGTFSAVPTEWAQILLHDGQVLAMSIKDG